MKIYCYTKLVIFIAFSVLIFIYAHELLEYLQFFIGSLMVAFGLEDIIIHLVVHKKEAFKEIKFLHGFMEVILGITMMAAISDFVVICVIWAVWSIVREMFEINEILCGKIKGSIAVVSFVESIVVFVFSFMLIITPTEHHAFTHIYLLIAELIVTAFSPVFDDLVVIPLTNQIKKRRKKVDNEQ